MAKATAACVTAHIVTTIENIEQRNASERAPCSKPLRALALRFRFSLYQLTTTSRCQWGPPRVLLHGTPEPERACGIQVGKSPWPGDAQEPRPQHHDHDMGESRLPVEQRQPCQWAPGHGLRFGERRATVSGHPATVLQPADDADSQAAHNESVGNLII